MAGILCRLASHRWGYEGGEAADLLAVRGRPAARRVTPTRRAIGPVAAILVRSR
jgi:hypothetical protein